MKEIMSFEEKALQEQTIEELETRIRLGNFVLKWLRSNDPMLREERYKDLVQPAIDLYTEQVRKMIVICRAKKIERERSREEFIREIERYSGLEWDDDGWDEAVKEYEKQQEKKVGLKSAKLKLRKL